MSNIRKKIAPKQLTLNFEFGKQLDSYVKTKELILNTVKNQPGTIQIENEYEACLEIAASIKRAIRKTGLSRDQIVDSINQYFGRSNEGSEADPPTCRKPLKINMLNNYLSRPSDYPIPAYYLYAIHHITGSLEPASTIVASEGAKIATGDELRQMALGKLDDNIRQMQKLKRELGGN